MISGRKKTNFARDRVEFKCNPIWIRRLVAHAQAAGLSISAYARLRLTAAMDCEDGADRERGTRRRQRRSS